jgi:transcriptional regulator with XRE-family HTH domain
MATAKKTLPRKKPKARAQSTIHLAEYAVVVELLREVRIEAGLTQAALGEVLGRNQTFISHIERAEWRIDLIQWLAWVAECGVKPEQFLRRLEKAAR